MFPVVVTACVGGKFFIGGSGVSNQVKYSTELAAPRFSDNTLLIYVDSFHPPGVLNRWTFTSISELEKV